MTCTLAQGLKNIIAMNRLLDEADSPMEIMVASIRDVDEMTTLAAEGLNVFTFSPASGSPRPCP